ncbi:MAG: hypothetical protein AABY32_01245 [Nanoarchaeota archaeon]
MEMDTELNYQYVSIVIEKKNINNCWKAIDSLDIFDEVYKDIRDAIGQFRYEAIFEYDDNNNRTDNISIIAKHNDFSEKDEKLLSAIAPFVKPDSYVIFMTEDQVAWKYTFEKGKLVKYVRSNEWNEVPKICEVLKYFSF